MCRTRDCPVITTAHGKRMSLRRDDRGISRELAVYHIHEPLETELLSRVIEEEMVVIDIGANIGYYVLMESSLVGPGGQVIAIEPSSENIESLNANLILNDIHNVTVIPAAVSDSDGKGNLYLSRSSNWQSLRKPPYWHPALGVREVSTWRIDTLVEKLKVPVNIVRMDIEGGEVAAFEGMAQTLERYKPRIAVEMHTSLVGRQSIVDVLKKLKTFGYNVMFIIDRDKNVPWNRTGHGVRTISIDNLMTDKDTIGAERITTVFLE
jgi:FkbM family methyltransferase